MPELTRKPSMVFHYSNLSILPYAQLS